MKLKEVVDMYGPFYNDYDLIKLYFKLNNCEEEAVDMLTELSKRVIANQREYCYRVKEYSAYANHIMCNTKIEYEDRVTLLHICQDFINNGTLSENRLKKAKDIFDKYSKEDFVSIPIFFLGYLQSNNIATYLHDCRNDRSETIESGGK